MYITVVDGTEPAMDIDLNSFDKDIISFGRDKGNDIVLKTDYVSRVHGCFSRENDGCSIHDLDSRHGLYYEGKRIKDMVLRDGDSVMITGPHNKSQTCVILVFRKDDMNWNQIRRLMYENNDLNEFDDVPFENDYTGRLKYILPAVAAVIIAGLLLGLWYITSVKGENAFGVPRGMLEWMLVDFGVHPWFI